MKENYYWNYLRPIARPLEQWSGVRKFMLLAISFLAVGQVAVASGKGGGSKGSKPGTEAQRGPGGDSLGRRGNFIDYAVERKGGDSIYRRGNFIDYAVERKGGDSIYRRGNFIDYAIERKGGDSIYRRGNFIDYAVERKGGDSIYRRGNFVDYSVERGPGGDSLGRIGVLQSNDLEVVAFPNPTIGMLNLRVAGNAEGNLTAGVMDLSGKWVLPMTAFSAHTTQLDLGQLPSGTYLVQVRTAKQTITKRIIKN